MIYGEGVRSKREGYTINSQAERVGKTTVKDRY